MMIKKLTYEFAIFFFFLLIYLLSYPELFQSFNTSYFGTGDSSLYVWLTKQHLKWFIHPERSLYNLPFYYPNTNTLAYSDNYLFPALVSLPIYLFSKNYMMAYNFPLLLASTLNAYCTYKLAKCLYGSRQLSLIAGLIFMFSPYFFVQLEHPQLQYAFIFPLAAYLIFKFFDTSKLTLILSLALTVLLAFFSAIYYLFFLLIFVALVILGKSLNTRGKPIKAVELFSLLLFGILLYSLTSPYQEVAKEFGTRNFGDVTLQASSASFLSASQKNPLWGELTAELSNWETRFSPGALALFLAFLGYLGVFENKTKKFVFSLALILFILSVQFLVVPYPMRALAAWGIVVCGAYFILTADRSKLVLMQILFGAGLIFFALAIGRLSGKTDLLRFEPYALFFELFPGFSALRASGRLAIVTYLTLSLLAPLGVTKLFSYLALNAKTQACLVGLILAAISFELRNKQFPTFSPPSTLETAAVSLISDPQSAILLLPYPRFERNEAEFATKQFAYMHLTSELPNPIVNGYSGLVPKFHRDLHRRLRKFPSAEALSSMKNIPNLKYVIYCKSLDYDFSPEIFYGGLKSTNDSIKLLLDQENYALFELSGQKANKGESGILKTPNSSPSRLNP